MRLSAPARRRAAAIMAATAVLACAGCDQRRLTPRPEPAPGTGTWVAVWLAALAVTAVLAVLIARRRPGETPPPWPALLLGAQAAVLWELTAVGVAVLARTRTLLDRAPQDRPATLVALSGADGDPHLYAVLAALVLVVVGVPAVVCTLAARAQSGAERPDRWIAVVTLAAQSVAGAVAVVAILVVDRPTWPLWALVVNAVPSAVAAWTVRPHLPDSGGDRARAAR